MPPSDFLGGAGSGDGAVVVVVVNADVRTMSASGKRDERASALAWRAGRIVAVGDDARVRAAAGPGTVEIDADGATVLPGFIDGHQHPSIWAIYGGGVRLAAPAVKNVAKSTPKAAGGAVAKRAAGGQGPP